ncbi:methyl-accepting chemotaxis protein [Rhizobium sp. SG_E_25_P2]|uniref:methyl-accepting chemotaxis protein n=1 Tax=Rhizobium sp. SG_E_25_P2 TaxID=2879942 RepID=UPI002474EEDB|nr:HAMP domain-containing methyl-accepting chemotaxis protein [Rhizobium sp. SG_E_25_P2]MDH6266732.1 methyl-accepting chemotaxis protein [Rhizobium sp. SG_E_25_P2]
MLAGFSIRTLLYVCIAVPLLGLAMLAGENVYSAYGRYSTMHDAIVLQRLASAGGELALSLPNEALSPPEKVMDARKRTDAAYQNLMSLYSEAEQQGVSDATVDKDLSFVRENWARLLDYRGLVDEAIKANDFGKSVQAGIKIQPMAAAAIDLTRRAGVLVRDNELSGLIHGFYAMMMINDATLIEIKPGEAYLKGAKIDGIQLDFLLHSRSLHWTLTEPMFESLPADVVAPYKDFLASDNYGFLRSVIDKLYMREQPVKADPEGEQRFMQIIGARIGMMQGMLETVANLVRTKADAKINSLWSEMVVYSAFAGGITLVSIFASLLCISNIRRPLHQIVGRMKALAEGDTQTPVPHEARGDEIGHIAHALAYFRTAEIEKLRLQADAENVRVAGERDRIEAQRKAEEDADRRLNETTQALAEGLRKLSLGDMTCEIEESFAPQFEQLRENFNISVRQLREALASVGNLAVEVDSGSAEISNASTNLAKRTENQAASLEETAAALEEITANVVATTKRTSDARGVAQTARDKADRSGKVVGDAVGAMQRIEQSSQQINQIISVIDEIAFQTNLLALNAGVEAARAGEAGKGFAVVAQEVRELAQRSANAAKEIKQLISNSATAVQEGVKLVHETGAGLGEIEQLVRDINQHMDAIATAAQEQSTGLSEVNTAVNHMDQATQQNAAMVEEMNAAGVGLATESSELRKLLSRFNLGGQSGAPLRQMAETMRRPSQPAAPAVRSAPRTASTPVRRAATGNAAVSQSAGGNWEEF